MQDIINFILPILLEPSESKNYILSGSVFILLAILSVLIWILIQKNQEIRDLHEIFMRRSHYKGNNEPPETKIYFRKRKR
jgi:hypothetical protein